MGTDGVFDNLYDDQIAKTCIRPHLKFDGDLPKPEDASLCVSALAEVMSYSETHVSPYTQGAIDHGKPEAFVKENLGGKQDDITVIVAQIKMH